MAGVIGNLGAQPAFLSAAILDAITSIKALQDLTKDLAPSSWSWCASLSMSTPALANFARTSSLSPPSAGRIDPSWSCLDSAISVFSGMVFTVNGAASDLMYKMSDAEGSLVPVLSHSGDVSRSRAALYVCMAMAIPSRLRSDAGTLSLTAASHRLTKSDATD